MGFTVLKKRDGRIVPFDMKKISEAIERSLRDDPAQTDPRTLSDTLAWEVTTRLEREDNPAPTSEHVQDLVEQVLMEQGLTDTARRFVLYRQARNDARARDGQGGTLVLENWEPSLSGQAMAICAAVRNNGGARRLLHFYESLAPAAENVLWNRFEAFFCFALEERTGNRVARKTLRAFRSALRDAGFSLLTDRHAALSRHADLVCGTLGFDREPVEEAQRAAWDHAMIDTREELHRTLRQLQSRGCTREIIAPPTELTPAIQLLLDAE